MLGEIYTPPSEERMTRDLVALARGRLMVTECPSGRPTIKNQPCAHCGVDFELEGYCGQPLAEDGYTPFDTTVARRIMTDSARNNGETE
jgi:hypothetical protein